MADRTSNQWVSVEDALPERQLRVLLAFKGMDWISIGGLQAQGFFCDECDGLVRDPYEVVAWRPLPPPFGSPVETSRDRSLWIRTSERAPHPGQRVFGHVARVPYQDFLKDCDGDPDCFNYVEEGRWYNCNSNNYLGKDFTVAWWMPCPDDPEDLPVKTGAKP